MKRNNPEFLIAGGGGYLGSVIVPILLKKGCAVRVLDRFFWGKDVFSPNRTDKHLTLIEGDTRSYPPHYLTNVDVVIDLAALSNDAVGELNKQLTLDINYHARVKTASLAKRMGVKKYILASTCSVYGLQDGILNETSKPAPITTYARASLLAENAVLSLSDNNFGVTVLRLGTLYGISPRMRFDLVVNALTLSLFKDNVVTVYGGEKWRPIVHVKDAAAAFIKVAEEEPYKINGEIFNVGASEQNYQIKDIAALIKLTLNPAAKIIIQKDQSDFRSFRVSCEKIKNTIQYKTRETPENGAREIYQALKTNTINETLETKTIDWYKYLLSKNPTILDIKTNS